MKTILLLFSVFLLISCERESKPVTRLQDYQEYLMDNGTVQLDKIDQQLSFWGKRLDKDDNDMVARSMMAGLNARRFSYSGDVNELEKASSWYQQVNKINKFSSSSTFRSLATVCITQHQFRLAKSYLDSALQMGDDKLRSLLLLSDVQLELGDNRAAIKTLDQLKDQHDFEVLIRRAKIQDKVYGRLDKSISILEEAALKPEAVSNPLLFNWIQSNLGDMYGHAGRYNDSYKSYLSVLKNDPNYYHCLKGIAWLAFSHDRDPARAKQIIDYLKARQSLPDHDLMLAAIAADEGNGELESKEIGVYLAKLNTGNFGAMYNAYTCKLFLENDLQKQTALQIAEEEVRHRPTVLSYSLLSWALLENGHKAEAIQMARTFVEGRTTEPEAVYRLGLLYAQSNDPIKARRYLLEARESGFELGPLKMKKIGDLLKRIG